RVIAAESTTLTGIFGPEHPEFNPMRVLRNRVVQEWADRADQVPHGTSTLPVIGHMNLGGQPVEMHKFTNLVPMRDNTTGDFEEMPLLAGQGVGLVRSVEPAATVVQEMTAQASAMLERFQYAH